ncbi:hypothetical protein NQ317_005148 [Molorchus minor]|uniref:Synaptotagmin SMP domain-containing protein n=1 Tax=Molorchus minor TaxID=1323400 RepID=A0ABQ9IZZ6_9CUCU|nr:hypothetical protein NQ317_005148 [Molorchus minor]
MQWSVAWFIGPVVLFVIRDQWKKTSDSKRAIAKATAMSSEKDVVLARLNDLPAWPFRIGGVKVYDKNVDRNEIVMDIDIFYAGDCDITFYLSGMKGGIRDFQVGSNGH